MLWAGWLIFSAAFRVNPARIRACRLRFFNMGAGARGQGITCSGSLKFWEVGDEGWQRLMGTGWRTSSLRLAYS